MSLFPTSQSEECSGNGWYMVPSEDRVMEEPSHEGARASTTHGEPMEAMVALRKDGTTAVDGESSHVDAANGKKRKLDEDEMACLRDTTFSDSTEEKASKSMDGPTSAKAGRFNCIRTTADVPAEGAGLRGNDAFVDQQGDESHAEPPSSVLAGTQRKLCIRHQRMADEGTTAKLQRSIDSLPLADQTAVNTVWSLFSSSPHPRRALMLQGILTMCCFSQLSLLSTELCLAIRIDPFSLFPREVSLKVLRYLDAMSLGQAAQVSRTWRGLADDDLIWRNMCEQHIERKCEKCGWGLPLLSERRRRVKRVHHAGSVESRQLTYPVPPSPLSSTGNLKRSITAAANAAAQERHAKSAEGSRPASPSGTSSGLGEAPTTTAATRPWKSVYCERLAIERNWRRGLYTTKVLTGHSDGIMCLQFSESLLHPTFPIVITGSYDRTARIWNMETGEELRVLKGHTRGVRCLQFDEAKLITGSMDRTLKIWNWRTGELMRTLEGHTEGIVCLNFNNDILASGSADSNVKIWNFRSGECYTLRGHSDWVNAVLLWSAKPGNSKTDFGRSRLEDPSGGAGTSPEAARRDGSANTFLFSASDDGTIRLWDLQARETLISYDGHVGQVQSIKLVMLDDEAIRKLGSSAGGGSGADHAESIQRREMRAQRSSQSASNAEVDQATYSSGSYFVAPPATSTTAGEEQTEEPAGSNTCAYNPPAVPGGRAANTGPAPAIPDRFALFNRDASNRKQTKMTKKPSDIDEGLLHLQARLCEAGLVAPLPIDAEMADLEGPLGEKWEKASEESDKARDHHQSQRPVLISASLDNTIRLWCVRTGRCIRTLFGHTEGIWSLSLDKLRIASASHDRCIKTWDTDTGMCKQTFVGHRGAVTCVQLGDDKIVSGSDDGDCRIWSFAPA